MIYKPYRNFCGPSYVSQSSLAINERCVNLYPERNEVPGATSPYILCPTPGLDLLVTPPEPIGRGIFAQSGRCFPAIGQTYYELTTTPWSLVSRGALLRDQYPVTQTSNGDGGNQNFITSGGRGDLFNLGTNTFTPGVVANATMGGFLDGFFIRFDINSSTIGLSNLQNGLVWDPTQFAQRSAAADPWRSMLIRYPLVWLFGEQTSDVWYNAGNFPFPLAPYQNVRIDDGIAAAFSAANLKNGPVWLARSSRGAGYIVQAQGYRTVRVSTQALEFQISRYVKIDDAVSFTYTADGHEFYELNFPTQGVTWVWDSSLGVAGWHERGHWNATKSMYEAWGPQYHAYEFDAHIVVDLRTGSIYRMGNDLYADADGDPMRRLRLAPGLRGDGKTRMFYDGFQLVLDQGIGLSTGQGSNPAVSMQYSNTAGKRWNSERIRRGAKKGELDHVTEWRNCGSTTGTRAFQVVMSDPVPWRIVDAQLATRPGA